MLQGSRKNMSMPRVLIDLEYRIPSARICEVVRFFPFFGNTIHELSWRHLRYAKAQFSGAFNFITLLSRDVTLFTCSVILNSSSSEVEV